MFLFMKCNCIDINDCDSDLFVVMMIMMLIILVIVIDDGDYDG